MMAIKDTSFHKIIEYKKYKDLYDFSSLECRISLISMILLNIIFFVSIKFQNTDEIISNYITHLDSIGISFIGFLGFIVTGLAILTGAISSKIVKRLQDRNKIQALERILLSFYLLGLVTAFVSLSSFICHFLKNIPVNSILQIDIILLSIISYLTVFSLFYAVKLIGNCLELFFIVNNMEIIENKKNKKTINLKSNYNSYRISILEKTILANKEDLEKYSKEIKELIKTDKSILDEERELYLKWHQDHFISLGK